MKRKILFRGKRLYNGVWVYGYVAPYTDMQGNHKCRIITDNDQFYEVDPATVGQFTGQNAARKDSPEQICRKQQVFEHDILANQNGNILGCVRFTDERGWMVGVESLYDYTDRYDEKEALIIGNIHDNPELLKGGEK